MKGPRVVSKKLGDVHVGMIHKFIPQFIPLKKKVIGRRAIGIKYGRSKRKKIK